MHQDIPHYSIEEILGILDFEPQKSGIYIDIRDHISNTPLSKPYTTENYTVIIVEKGHISLEVNLIPLVVHPAEVLIINPLWVINFKEFSPKVKFTTISFDKSWLTQTTQNSNNSFTLLAPSKAISLLLTPDQLVSLQQISELIQIKNTQSTSFTNYKSAISHLFSLLLLELHQISLDNNSLDKETLNAKQQLAKNFLELLPKHFTREKTLCFYANKLCVSTGYLAKAVKKTTGKTTGELIQSAVITQASLLLLNTTLSVSEIAQELHFENTSFFGKYFKRATGFSPTEYRKQF